MNYHVLLRMVPDPVEDLEVGPDGKSLDEQSVRLRPSDTDEHALEEALLLKERFGGTVTAVALEAPEVDEALFTALAKGADRAVKLVTDSENLGTVATARTFASFLGGGGHLEAGTLILGGRVGSVVGGSPPPPLPGCRQRRLGIGGRPEGRGGQGVFRRFSGGV